MMKSDTIWKKIVLYPQEELQYKRKDALQGYYAWR